MRLMGKSKWLLAAAGLLSLAGVAHAESITLQLVSGPVAVGSEFAYTYQATLVADVAGGSSSISNNGDSLFSIVDFGGLDTAATSADITNGTDTGLFGGTSAWTFNPVAVQSMDVGVFPFDSAAIPDATFLYHGPTETVSFPGGFQTLGNFTIVSTVAAPTPLHFYGANDTETDSNGTMQESNQSLILAPGPGGPSSMLPTPATAVGGIVLMGMLGIAGMFRTIRQRLA